MTIIIPMAGLSSRFLKAGYTLPKYMLYIRNRSLFNIAVSSFEYYFKSCKFVFVARDLFDTPKFIDCECKLMGVENYEIVTLSEPTKGQAETVYLGIQNANVPNDEPILIFNIDTFRPGYRFPKEIKNWDGYLEVFVGSGANWSYAKTESEDSTRVIETAEKKEISQYCSTGLYYFKSAKMFVDAYRDNNGATPNGINELYVAPLYNKIVSSSDIHIHVIERGDVIFSGVPDEYEFLLHREFSE